MPLSLIHICHHNIEGVGDKPHRHRRFEDPAHDEGRLELCHVVVLGDHLDQLITGDEGQDDACNRQHHIPGEGFDQDVYKRQTIDTILIQKKNL